MGDAVEGIAKLTPIGGASQARKSRKEAAKARKLQERARNLQSARGIAEQVRQAQVARAQVIQAGENQGVAGSSAVAGGASSVQAQAGGNIAFAQQLFGLQSQAFARMEASHRAASKAADSKALTDLVMKAGGGV